MSTEIITSPARVLKFTKRCTVQKPPVTDPRWQDRLDFHFLSLDFRHRDYEELIAGPDTGEWLFGIRPSILLAKATYRIDGSGSSFQIQMEIDWQALKRRLTTSIDVVRRTQLAGPHRKVITRLQAVCPTCNKTCSPHRIPGWGEYLFLHPEDHVFRCMKCVFVLFEEPYDWQKAFSIMRYALDGIDQGMLDYLRNYHAKKQQPWDELDRQDGKA